MPELTTYSKNSILLPLSLALPWDIAQSILAKLTTGLLEILSTFLLSQNNLTLALRSASYGPGAKLCLLSFFFCK